MKIGNPHGTARDSILVIDGTLNKVLVYGDLDVSGEARADSMSASKIKTDYVVSDSSSPGKIKTNLAIKETLLPWSEASAAALQLGNNGMYSTSYANPATSNIFIGRGHYYDGANRISNSTGSAQYISISAASGLSLYHAPSAGSSGQVLTFTKKFGVDTNGVILANRVLADTIQSKSGNSTLTIKDDNYIDLKTQEVRVQNTISSPIVNTSQIDFSLANGTQNIYKDSANNNLLIGQSTASAHDDAIVINLTSPDSSIVVRSNGTMKLRIMPMLDSG
jgi:hypothetical protein